MLLIRVDRVNMKVFITGIGSDLGTQIASLLEQRPTVTAIAGVDMYPPRRYLARSRFFMSRYDDSERIAQVIINFSPDVIINFGVYEPGARLNSLRALNATQACTTGIIHAVKEISSDHDVHVITRSSVVVYGFSNSHTHDETSPLSPDTPYGKMCRDVEEELTNKIPYVTIIRTAPEIGAHVPHPLARLLTLPAFPVQARLPFSRDIGFPIISPRDAIEIFVRAAMEVPREDARHRVLHAACSNNATMMMAAREGNRIPLFTSGVGFALAKRLSFIAGAPIDPHVEMFIRRGMIVDSTSTRMYLGITSQDSPTEIIKDLYSGAENIVDSPSVTEVPK